MNKNTATGIIAFQAQNRGRSIYLFGLLWLILFLLYLPAAKGGWVSDTVEEIQKIRGPFWEYINRRESRGNMYQFTQLTTYFFYLLFGTKAWLWHLLFITLQATNATLLFVISSRLFAAAGIKKATLIAAGGVLLFCICPHLSEVMVWKASFHYLQAMLLILCILYCVQQYHTTPSVKYVCLSLALFFCSTFSDEFFFITPFLVFSLIAYYRWVLGYDKTIFRKALLYFFLPVCLLILGHILFIAFISGSYAGDAGDEVHQPVFGYLRKPPLYLFHVIFFGRFLAHSHAQAVYDFFASRKGIILFWGFMACLWGPILIRFKKINPSTKAAVLILFWAQVCIAMVCPVWFPETLLVNFDRYTYFMLPFIYLLLMLLLVQIKVKEIAITLFILYAAVNIYLTVKVTRYWGQSACIADHLVHSVPPTDNKVVLLLNVPEYMNGVPIIGPFHHYSFRQMYNLNNVRQINNAMYDVVSYNMTSPSDGAHVNVYGDTVVHVTLNQWGTWWWSGMWGAFSYENEYYKVNMIDQGHWYELKFKKPISEYVLLYNVGDQWKKVDLMNKNTDQN